MKISDPLCRKIDMHIHTPRSVCYSDLLVKPENIVDAAVSAGLDMIAIVDHNAVDGIDEIRQAAGDRICVLPGIEITTKNGHFLAYFDAGKTKEELDEFLDYAGIDPKGRGDAHAVAGDETIVTLKKIHEYGGIAIAAHIDRWPSGFLETKITRRNKRKIHESEYLDGLEITIPDTRQAWNNGDMRDFPMKRPCIQGSDAHKPEEVGRRPVYIRMETPGLAELKKALVEYDTDICFPEDINDNA